MTYKALLAAVAAGMLAAACDGGGSTAAPTPPPPPPPPPPPASFSSSFGAGFETAFQQAAFDEPLAVEDGDIIDVDITADPLAIPDDPS
jgi:hypothetical protein